MITIFASPADEGGPLDWAKDFIIPRNVLLESLTWVNKSAADIYIQLFDVPRKMDVAITGSAVEPDNWFVVETGHGFQDGDEVTLALAPGGTVNGWLHNIDATHISLHTSRAEALTGTTPEVPASAAETGTLNLSSLVTTPPVPEEYPVLMASSAPSNVGSYTNARFKRGLYVRAVTAVDGDTKIASNDVKFTPRYRTGDIITPASVAYLD